MQLLLDCGGDKGSQTMCKLQVSSSYGTIGHQHDLTICIVVPGLPFTASVSPHRPLTNTGADSPSAVQGMPKVTLEAGSQGRLCRLRAKAQQDPRGRPRGIGAN